MTQLVITATVTDAHGNAATAEVTVDVLEPPASSEGEQA